ncbi:minor tail subunit [Gordonia phage Lucky10]|uniref:Minor tail subunit n=1 Tax=Gordonia phage Lucky10 TaxID=1821557 RepID=A0A142KAX8_9CAUD|nr:minor tail subunit [Gordonia phage Lucky10]AMS03261.1 minor tail subunit [Gordonia phage Lucky10]
MTAGVVVPYTGSDIDDFALWAREIRETRIARIARPARVELYDGNWNYRGQAAVRLAGELDLIENDTGSIVIELPIDMKERRRTFLAHWALNQEARGTTNIHIIVEKDGARIGGRADPKKGVTLKRSPDGDRVILTFLEDTQELKHVHMAAAPFLPVSLIQQPKVQFVWAPADWGGLVTLGMNVLRNQGTNFNMNLDLLDQSTWTGGLWAQAQIVPVPRKLTSSVAPTTIITGTIKQSWWDVMAPILEDAELMIVTRRFKKGDPEPWAGAGTNWRQGTLFVDIVDKSGWRSGTSIGGNLATGLARTIANVTSNYVEDSYDLLTGAPVDTSGYKLPGFLSTQPPRPHAIYRDGEITGVQNFELTRGAGGPVRITAGGKSMPGVNELLEAVIGYGGDVLGDNISIAGYGVGSLGSILNAFLMPILKDSMLAYMSVPLLMRSAKQGWGHYLETAATGVTQAYTPSSIMDLRKRRRETDPDTAFSFEVASGVPLLIGDRGQGHWWLGDRVGATTKYLGARVFVARCRGLTLPLGGDDPQMWKATFGDRRTKKDALERLVETAATAFSALQEIGAF